MKYYLYNPLANNGIKPKVDPKIKLVDALGLNYPNFFATLKPDDEVVLLGGDGTLNFFINAMHGYTLNNNVYLLGSGTGNDFFTDIGHHEGDEVLINEYIKNLPTVKVKGMEKVFINNMGFGIDGYCCEVADTLKDEDPNVEINYTSIAIKGLLFHFKPCHATVTVDGQIYEFDDVWIAPTMKGRYYGGGMKMAPDQDRNSDVLTLVIYRSPSKLKALMQFPSIFKGEHIKNKDMVSVFTGKHITVKFSKPCSAQIDGETVMGVTEYEAYV